jgi:uncharacterized protein YggE
MLGLVPALALAGLVGWVSRGAASASSGVLQPSPDAPIRNIQVVGNGKITVKPDIATIHVGIETRNESADAAASANAERMEAVLNALKSVGIAEKDIQTTNYSIYADQQRGPNGEIIGSTQYVVSNMVRATVRNLDQVGEVLDRVVDAGANQVHGISFGVADMSAIQLQAEESALDDAKARAEKLAAKAGVQLGEILSISETIGSAPMPVDAYYKEVAQAAAGAVPVQPGELEFNAQVQVVYAMR